MAGYEIYAGKRLAGLKAEFLRHEYTWSKQSIGGTIGLGITSSSSPKEKIQLREMEKMAGMAEPDSVTGMEVELLMYSPEAGFVKLAVKPVPAGEDQRKNKKVYLYQCMNYHEMDPAVYSIPHGSWDHMERIYLPPVELSENWASPREILNRYQLTDRLPDFFRAVFWCVFRGSTNLAIQVAWDREEYASRAREVMYAIHALLPPTLRKQAGYASWPCGMNRRSSFYFTEKEDNDDLLDLTNGEYIRRNMQEDALDRFFYDTLASIYQRDEKEYREFIQQVEDLIHGRKIDKNTLKEVQCLFLQFCIQHMLDIPALGLVLEELPQLFYAAGDSKAMREICDNLLSYYHMQVWQREDYEHYLKILSEGISRKSEAITLAEMDWTISRYSERYKKLATDYLASLHKERPMLYTKLMTNFIGKDQSIAGRFYRQHRESLPVLKDYICAMEAAALSQAVKDRWMLDGIEILNQDVFEPEHFQYMTQIAEHLGRKKQWVQLMQGFLTQLTERCEELDELQLDRACEIEELYSSLSGKQQDKLKEERKNRNEKTEEAVDEMTEERYELIPEEEHTDVELYRSLEEEEKSGRFLPFLIRGLPYGFLTGSILYLLNYALVIGHWKISLGVGGMWLILMLNYATERIERKKQDGYRLWQALGLCLVEGYIIQTIAWVFLPQTIKVYFFLLLGILTVIIQSIQGLILLKKREEEEI